MSEITKERKLNRLEALRAECRFAGGDEDECECGACEHEDECDAIESLIESSVPAPSPTLTIKQDLTVGPSVEEASGHPEDCCHRCGDKNLKSWYADNDVWNAVMRPGPGPELFDGIVCPICFTEIAAQKGIKPTAGAWRLSRGCDDPPLPKEVREAMKLLYDEVSAVGMYRGEIPEREYAALAVLKAALQRFRELCTEVGEKP